MLTRELLAHIVAQVVSSPVFTAPDSAEELEDYTRRAFALGLPKDLPAGLTMAAMNWGVAQVMEQKAQSFNA